jgi:hypothetical protein
MHQQLTKAERMNHNFQSPATHEKDERVLEHTTLLEPRMAKGMLLCLFATSI